MSPRLRFLSIALIVPVLMGSSHRALAQWGYGYSYGYPMNGYLRYGYQGYPSYGFGYGYPRYGYGYGYRRYGGYGYGGYGGYGYPGYGGYGYGGYGRRGYYGGLFGFYDSGIGAFGGGTYPGAAFGFSPGYLAQRAFTAGGVVGGLTYGTPQPVEPEPPPSTSLLRAATSPAPIPTPPAPESVTLNTTATTTTSAAPENIVLNGQTAFRNGDYAAAVEDWRNALDGGSRNPVLVMMLAQACFAAGDYRQAAATTREAMQALPEDRWGVVVSNRRELYVKPNTYLFQIEQLKAAVKERPKDPAQRFLLAFHYAYLGYPQAAAAQLDKFAELEPGDEMAAQFRKVLALRLPTAGAPVITPGVVTPAQGR